MADRIRRDLKPNLKFGFVPIKEVNIGGNPQQKDWLRTETFLDIVSTLLKEEDVQRAGGFMVIRPKNHKGALPFLYPTDHNHEHYNPKQHDMNHTMNVFGIQNLKTYFKAQIHDQTCKEVKSPIFKWNDDSIYSNHTTVQQQFQSNESNLKKRKKMVQRKKKSSAKRVANQNTTNNLPFDVITTTNGERITQTQSGRIVKVYSETQDFYDKLDRYLEGTEEETEAVHDSDSVTMDDDEDNDLRKRKRNGTDHATHAHPNDPPTKKRKLSETEHPDVSKPPQIQIHSNGVFTMEYETNAMKYQYPFQLTAAMPEPHEYGHETNDFKLETRNSYTHRPECKTKSNSSYHESYDDTAITNRMPSPSVSSRSASPQKRSTMDIRRGFACVIEQIEKKQKKNIETFWGKKLFETQVTSSVYDGATPEEVPLIFCDYLQSAETVQYAIVDEETTYHFESPLQLNQLSRYGPFSALRQNEVMLGIELPYVYIGQQHAFFPFHREDMNLFAVNHLLWGCHKLWYCIDPKDHGRVLQFVREQYCAENERLRKCETPLQHKLFWFDPYILLSMGIKVWFIRQKVGDIVITPPGGIHGGLNTGPNMAESINFMTYDIEMCWKPVLSAMLYYCHNFECDVCITHAFLDVNRLAMRLREKEGEEHKSKVPDTKTIYEALPISQTISHVPKYKNADKYISRSFTWNERLSLRSRYLHSNEYKEFNEALTMDRVYPYYIWRESDYKVCIYPIGYNGSFKHRIDALIFEPLYSISYVSEEGKQNEYVSLKYILKEYSVERKEWDQEFDEKAIRLRMQNELQMQNINIVFVYEPQMKRASLSNHKMMNSVERRKKIKSKRVIADSDTESDDD